MQTLLQTLNRLKSQRDRMERDLKALEATISTLEKSMGGKHHIVSKTAREKIAAAQRKRWARQKAADTASGTAAHAPAAAGQ